MASVSMAARESFLVTRRLRVGGQDEIAGGAQRPFAADAHKIDAAGRVFPLQAQQQRVSVDARGQSRRQGLFIEGLFRRKQQRFEYAQFFGAILFVPIADDHTHLRNIGNHSESLPHPITCSDATVPPLGSRRLRT